MVESSGELPFLCVYDDEHVLDGWVIFVEFEVRQKHARIILAEERSGRLVHGADDEIFVSVNGNRFPNGIDVCIKALGEISANDCYRSCPSIILIADEAAQVHVRLTSVRVLLFDAGQIDPVHVIAFVARLNGVAVPKCIGRNAFTNSAFIAKSHQIRIRKVLTRPLFRGGR